MTGLEIRLDLRDFERVGHDIESYVTTQAPPRIAAIVINNVRALTARGLDADGHAFAAYVARYAQWRNLHHLQISPVNLRVKRADSITDLLMTEGNVVTVPQEKEGQAEGLMNKRDFLAVGKPTLGLIENDMADGINQLP